MANVKITQLAAEANPASDDVLPFVDISADETKKVTIANLLENAGGGSANAAAFAFDGDPGTGMYRTGANALGFTTGGTGRLFIDSGGRIGVGVSSPGSLLHLSASSPRLTFTDTDTGVDHRINCDSSQGSFILDADFNSENSSSKFIFKVRQGDRMVINSSGNVGLSETSPQDRLHIKDAASSTSLRVTTDRSGSTYGNACIVFDSPRSNSADGEHHDGRGMISCLGSSSSNNGIVWLSAGSASLHPTESDTDLKANQCGLRLESNGSLELWASDNKRFTIDSSGRVGIGATSPTNQMHASGTGDVLRLDSSSTDAGIILYDSVGASRVGTRSADLIFDTGSLERMRISNAGVVTINSGFVTLNGSKVGGIQVTIADNAFAEITPPKAGAGFIAITEGPDEAFPISGCQGFVYCDWGDSPSFDVVSIGGQLEVSSQGAAPDGTTGSDDHATLFSGGTSGKVYLENRLGQTGIFALTFL